MKSIYKIAIISVYLSNAIFASMADEPLLTKVTFNQLEYQTKREKTFSWDSSIWMGYDIKKVYIYSEGEKIKNGETESQNQLLFSYAIAPYWDIQTGLGYDTTKDHGKGWAIVAINGLAPYFFETQAALLLSEDGNVGLRAGFEYEALITQKLILTPSVEADLYTKEDSKMSYSKGLSNISASLRLRYEIKREFAPYIGIEWNKNKFNTTDESYFTIGARIWF